MVKNIILTKNFIIFVSDKGRTGIHNTYIDTRTMEWHCDCIGYSFRHNQFPCKHIKQGYYILKTILL